MSYKARHGVNPEPGFSFQNPAKEKPGLALLDTIAAVASPGVPAQADLLGEF
jgi:hypothetical protein